MDAAHETEAVKRDLYAFWPLLKPGGVLLGDDAKNHRVFRALVKTFRMASDQGKVQQMRGTIDAVWPIFDDDNSGVIEREEFLKPNDGLADTIIATLGLELR